MGDIRINKIIKKYNIGLQTLLDFLKKKGLEIDPNPNNKIPDKYLPAIDKQYGKDLALKEASEKVEIKLTEIIETTTEKQKEEFVNEEEDDEPIRDEAFIKTNNLTPDEAKTSKSKEKSKKTSKTVEQAVKTEKKVEKSVKDKKVNVEQPVKKVEKSTTEKSTTEKSIKKDAEEKISNPTKDVPETITEEATTGNATANKVKLEHIVELEKKAKESHKVELDKKAKATKEVEDKITKSNESKPEIKEAEVNKEAKKADDVKVAKESNETELKEQKKIVTSSKNEDKGNKKNTELKEKEKAEIKAGQKAEEKSENMSEKKKADKKESVQTPTESKKSEKSSKKETTKKDTDKSKSEKNKSEKNAKSDKETTKKSKNDSKEENADDDSGLTIVGKIDLSQFEPKKKKKKKKRERIKKDTRKVDVDKVSKDNKDNKNKDNKGGGQKRKKNTRNDNNSQQRNDNGKGSKKRRTRGKRSNAPMTESEKEEMQKQIQKQVKETYAKMNENKNKSHGARYRKEKREQTKQKVEAMLEQEAKQDNLIKVTEYVTVSDLATLMDNTAPIKVIEVCMSLGLMVSINQRLDAETIVLVAEEFGYKIEFVTADLIEAVEQVNEDIDDEENMVTRPPVITVMGHVDHGKTSLLDHIRKANVIAGEAGGITQHIGAYNVKLNNGKRITFLDTPGHEAFTAMRARGAQLTDLAIIIIAADDAVMPQTKEAINHAQAAGVPMVFAINKVDKPGAQPEKIRQQLSQMNILVEDWGGPYQCQEISAKQGLNVDQLLEKVVLETELLDLKANPKKRAVGAVIESSLDKGRGYLATVLIQEGTIKVGDVMLSGQYTGKVKALFNERGNNIEKAGPSTPVLVLGLNGAPSAGEKFNVMDDEREAKDIANQREQLIRMQGIKTQKHMTLEEIGRRIAVGNFKELNLIVKGDVDGSVEALSDSLIELSTDQVRVNVIHKAVGAISESDILLAEASDAIIIGFQVRPSSDVRKLAEKSGIEIRLYSIIYDAINEVTKGIEGMLEPIKEEKITATVQVKQVFKISKVGTIAGCMVKEGKLTKAAEVRLIRDGIVVYTGKIESLKRGKDDAKEVGAGYECGLNIENFNDVKVGDVIEAYEIVEIKQSL